MPRVVVASIPGVSSRENEDAVALGDGVAVVVDGAGLPKDLRRGCRHSVQWHAENLATAFRDHLELLGIHTPAALTSAADPDELNVLIASIRHAEERAGELVEQAIKQHDDATIVAANFEH